MIEENTSDHAEIQSIVLEFIIPYPLDLPDSMNPEDGWDGYTVVVDGVPATIRSSRIRTESGSIGHVEFTPYGHILNDRYGLLSRTKVQVSFDEQMLRTGRMELRYVKDITRHPFIVALKYLNKLIYDYKRVTRESWPSPIRNVDVIGFSYNLIRKNGTVEQGAAPICNLVQFSDRYPTITKDQDINLRQRLMINSISLFDDLWLSVFDYFDRGIYNVALIQCAIVFESFMSANLNEINRLHPELLSKTKLDKIRKKDGCGCLIGVQEICQRGLKKVFDFDFGNTKEFDDLRDNVILPRNKIVHGGDLKMISRDCCERAISSTENAIFYVNKNLFLKYKQ